MWSQREQAEASESRKLAEAEAREAREAIEKAQAEAADVAAAQIQMDREQMEADLILAAGEEPKIPKRVRKSGGDGGPSRTRATAQTSGSCLTSTPSCPCLLPSNTG